MSFFCNNNKYSVQRLPAVMYLPIYILLIGITSVYSLAALYRVRTNTLKTLFLEYMSRMSVHDVCLTFLQKRGAKRKPSALVVHSSENREISEC